MSKMKIAEFKYPTDRVELTTFISGFDRGALKIIIASRNARNDTVYVIYETDEEKTSNERLALSTIRTIAEQVRKDPIITGKKLKNAAQRRMYLLSRHDLNSTQADMVLDWIAVAEVIGEKEQGK